MSLSEVNFHGNFLDNEFAVDLSYVLERNQVLFKVDISQNPIGPDGAKYILNALLQYNDTLGSLGDLSENVFMGVRVRHDLEEALRLNNASSGNKKRVLDQTAKGRTRTFVEGASLEKENTQPLVPISIQAEYPLLKPITFTNVVEDDYLESGVWHLRGH